MAFAREYIHCLVSLELHILLENIHYDLFQNEFYPEIAGSKPRQLQLPI
jgi:hypothetical protein